MHEMQTLPKISTLSRVHRRGKHARISGEMLLHYELFMYISSFDR